ncbi:HNH/ENDO VII superfamily nuclease [Pseudoduganella lurida]|uniref:HNH/ENDO VII superfamily nuclease n=1 Tax=Pseudoduganella lurida TaxID=1036180 RepID=A0A562RAV2_9BURK|nr:AHH domain-containing protein [Pseudoduganella lurida]TWI66185.1 HNH/ENDO VII superfamily nuclease [Pseudoduganella lurida]
MPLKLGNSSKDSKYLKTIKTAIEHNKAHPRHHGVKMQAHHLISGEGMKRTNLGKKIEKFGYDINNLMNLAFIPCTLQGACYLGVQPHRGNHTAAVDQDDYDDDNEPITYHDVVAKRLTDLQLPLAKECKGAADHRNDQIKQDLDKLSARLAKLIQNSPAKLPLTSIAASFTTGSLTGCGGVDSVGLHRPGEACPVKRHHAGNKQGTGQKEEAISFESSIPFTLKPGR